MILVPHLQHIDQVLFRFQIWTLYSIIHNVLFLFQTTSLASVKSSKLAQQNFLPHKHLCGTFWNQPEEPKLSSKELGFGCALISIKVLKVYRISNLPVKIPLVYLKICFRIFIFGHEIVIHGWWHCDLVSCWSYVCNIAVNKRILE